MATHVLTNASLVYNSVDLSDHVRTITVSMSAEDVDLTAMGSTSRTHAPGLRDDRVEVEFLQDFASGKVDQTLSSYVGNATGATLVVKPVATTVSTTNPSYTMTAILLDYQPLSGTVGEANTINVTFVPAPGSSITRATS